MTRDEILSRIAIDPNVCFGKPCIRGHRIWVSLVLDFLASGWSIARASGSSNRTSGRWKTRWLRSQVNST
ncbi:MAG: hypothetical protein B7Z73_02225 [Planctomycetia bacterium 21-64-5]|nr:MAG: hypothetical protein B7Z73_02225 [Planctomycetia bacterium 21-64-5]